MKRVLCLLLLVNIMFAFAACNKQSDTAGPSLPSANATSSEASTEIDYENLVWEDLDTALQNQILLSKLVGTAKDDFLAECQEGGYTVSFPEDEENLGSTVLEKDGDKTIQNADSSLHVITAEGNEMLYGFRWYKQYTAAQLPEPTFGNILWMRDFISSSSLEALVDSVTIKQFQTYRDACIQSGFVGETKSDSDTSYYFEGTKGEQILALTLEDGQLYIFLTVTAE